MESSRAKVGIFAFSALKMEQIYATGKEIHPS